MRAVTRHLDGSIDLESVARHDGYLFVRDGVGYAARGVAAEVWAEDAVSTLSAIPHLDRTTFGAPGPIAFGCVPFIPGSPARLVIPSVIVGRDSAGNIWETRVLQDGSIDADGDAGLELESNLPGESSAHPTPTTNTFSVRPITPESVYLDAVRSARDAVRSGSLVKAVIARAIGVESSEPMDVHAVLVRLRASFGTSYRYSFNGFVGASPELLVAVDGDTIRSHPLAGTTARTGDPDTDDELARRLTASMKNQIEHRVVIDSIHETLLPYCSYLDWEPGPSVVKVANVQHLGTRMEGMLSTPHPSVVELVRLLSPTPALGGHPRDEAIDLISDVEGFERGRYGGAVGYVDAAGNGIWAVAIRGAEFSADRRSARLIAGGGIVADSDEFDELAETQSKFQAMLSAIVRP